MRDDRNMRIAGNVALSAIVLGLAWYFVRLGIEHAAGFPEAGPSRDVLQYIWTAAGLVFSALSLVSWWFLARSSLNGARLLFINVAASAASMLVGFVIWAIVRRLHNFETVQNVSTAVNLLLTAFTIAVFAILVSKNAGRARIFLSMFLATATISVLLQGLIPFMHLFAVSHGELNMAFVIPLRIIAVCTPLLSTAAWLLVHTESHLPAGCVEGKESDRKRVLLRWRIFIVAIPLLALTNMSSPGRTSALLFFAPAGILGAFVAPNTVNADMPFLLVLGYVAYIAAAVAILWSRTRKALLYSVTVWFLLALLNVAGCVRMLNGLHF